MEVGRKPDLCWVEPAHPRTLQADLQQLGLGPAQEPQFQFLIWQHKHTVVFCDIIILPIRPYLCHHCVSGAQFSSREDGGSFSFPDLDPVPEQEDAV